MIDPAILASFHKEANFLTKAVGFGRKVVGADMRAARQQMHAAEGALSAAKKKFAPGGVTQGKNLLGQTAPRIKMPAHHSPHGSQIVRNNQIHLEKAQNKVMQASSEMANARRTLAKGTAAATVGTGGILAGGHMLKKHLEKQAASEAELRRKRHEYYLRNRQRMLTRSRQYRLQNKAVISRKKKKYNREVKSGVRKQRRRIAQGSHSFGYTGFR